MHSSKIKHIVVAVSMALASLSVSAAGLGKLNVLSNLGEPLKADIELLSVSPDELSSITAAIASNEAYATQGIDKPNSHNDIKIEVSKNTRGTPILKLNSTQPVTDAFIDMLIQVDWSSGRLLREYTLLLDPPGYSADSQSSQPKSSAQLPVVSAPSKAIAEPVDTLPPMSGSASPTNLPPLVDTQAKTQKKSSRVKPKAEATELDVTPADSQEYTTMRGDTLVKIANDMKPEGVSLEQMLVGLYQANPNAFDGKNMNRLKVGKIIRAPSQDALDATSSKAANNQVRVHTANWNAYKNKLAGIVQDSQLAQTDDSTQSSSGKVTTAEDKSAPASSGPKDIVKLSAGDASKTESASDKALKDKVIALQEEATAKQNALNESQSRTADLEKQIEDMKKLMALKSDAMAKIQKDAVEAAKTEAAKPVDVVKPVEVVKPVITEPATPAEVKKEDIKAEPPVVTPVVEPAKTTPPVVKAPMSEIAPEEPSFIGSLLGGLDLNTLGLAGGGLATLGGAWLFLRNKRKKSLASFEEGIMTSGGLKANTVFGNTAGGTVDTGDTSFLTDFSQSPSGGMIDSHDVDPIAEAEVYMAYGRDAQAEEILKDAIVKEPKRYELHLKLLEIYQTSGNASAFEAMSGELYTTLGAEDPVWAKVAQIGKKMDASNPLYQVAAVALGGATLGGLTQSNISKADKEAFLSSLESTTLGSPTVLETSSPDTVSGIPDAPEPVANEAMFDLDIGALEPLGGDTKFNDTSLFNDVSMEVQAPTHALDIDLDELSLGEANKESFPSFDSMTLDTEKALNSNTLDFEIQMPTVAEASHSSPQALDVPTIDFPTFETKATEVAEPLGGESIVFNAIPDMPSLDEEKSLTVASADFMASHANEELPSFTKDMDDTAPSNFDFTDISLDMDDTSSGSPTAAMGAKGEPEEVETKLDLVMAYIDMEDTIGAKELLDEVLKEGGENQRKRAAEIMAKIS